jgi:hypothetical protein
MKLPPDYAALPSRNLEGTPDCERRLRKSNPERRRRIETTFTHWTNLGSPQGRETASAHQLLQVRCVVLDCRLEEFFREWYPKFRLTRSVELQCDM